MVTFETQEARIGSKPVYSIGLVHRKHPLNKTNTFSGSYLQFSLSLRKNGIPKTSFTSLKPSLIPLHFLPPSRRRARHPPPPHQPSRRQLRLRFLPVGYFPPSSALCLGFSAEGCGSGGCHVESRASCENSSGTAVYAVSNSNNEFVLISDPNGAKSVGLLCFRLEDAEAFLAQVRLRRRELRSNAKVVPIALDQVYSLKVEGIAFRFLPDPIQIKNALELKASDIKSGFVGVPVFQSDLLVVRKKNKRFLPIYFNKEDIEKELSKVSRASRGPGVSQHIMVGSLEDVLKKMEMSEKNSGWDDLIFIPPEMRLQLEAIEFEYGTEGIGVMR
ncbi:Protein TIC 22 [Hibiscus syriacus]|uniref:Protein TIC 22, chloroplastic n=1 Tax=Hibiscus syriacus TaxID=106335 RepID=A0A6A3CS06_HIBSY|nr:Protein TIC 22 [Hibiscus syriacus]